MLMIKGGSKGCALLKSVSEQTGACLAATFEITSRYCNSSIARSPLHSIAHWNLFRRAIAPCANAIWFC